MSLSNNPIPATRIGFYYQPDSLHYTHNDQAVWLPRLKELGAGWLVLKAPAERAIPETFITALLQNGIQPVLHFDLSLHTRPDAASLGLLFSTYASWGVRLAILFDRPNLRQNWPAASWAQTDLVERFLDIYLPLAARAAEAGLTNIFPPLEPGGDYWDTAFLRAALQSLQRRGRHAILDQLVLGAYAWSETHPLRWGCGGPERWPGARPYLTPSGQEDQRGLYIFDWYNAIAAAVLHREPPIFLVGAGSRLKAGPGGLISDVDEANHAHHNLEVARLFARGQSPEDYPESGLPPAPHNVLAACFWLLAAPAGSPQAAWAWHQPDGSPLPAADALRHWNGGQAIDPVPAAPEEAAVTPDPGETGEAGAPPEEAPAPPPAVPAHQPVSGPPAPKTAAPGAAVLGAHTIKHYLLLPLYEWGAAEWHLDAARPFILRHHPTVGFSTTEAALACQVTVVGSEQMYPDQLLAGWRASGSIVRRINGDGTEIASQLANL